MILLFYIDFLTSFGIILTPKLSKQVTLLLLLKYQAIQ